MFGAAVALQAPHDGVPGLTAPLVGLALALAAYALAAGLGAPRGTRRRRASAGALTAAVAGAALFSTSSLHSTGTSDARWLYVASGVVVAGAVWYRLHAKARGRNRG
jgi:hypothetical protein